MSEDGLPLYAATDAGRALASEWLTAPPVGPPDWQEMVEQLALATTLPGVDASPLVKAYQRAWREYAASSDVTPLTRAARSALADAAERVLASVAVVQGAAPGRVPFSAQRVRRGRPSRRTP